MSSPLLPRLPTHWKQILRRNFNHLDRLADFLELTAAQRALLLNRPAFPLNLPLRLAQKIKKGTLDDPILKQFLPTVEEHTPSPHFILDPVHDNHYCRSSKLLHKYQGRALLVCTSACAMHCRYCFRQNFEYDVANKMFSEELKIIAEDPSLHEIILSGGDPLSLSDEILNDLISQIVQIPHVKRIRFHTRFPIGIPERIDESFLALIAAIPTQIWFVIHCNHPHELDEDIWHGLKELQRRGCVVLNQAVLLKGVNDEVDTLKELCELLVDHGILPYYLHQLDRVQGAAHFEVQEEQGRVLIQEIAKWLPGYAIPKYVREIAGEPNKTPL